MEKSKGRSIRDKHGNFQLFSDRKTFGLSPTTHMISMFVQNVGFPKTIAQRHHITSQPLHIVMCIYGRLKSTWT